MLAKCWVHAGFLGILLPFSTGELPAHSLTLDDAGHDRLDSPSGRVCHGFAEPTVVHKFPQELLDCGLRGDHTEDQADLEDHSPPARPHLFRGQLPRGSGGWLVVAPGGGGIRLLKDGACSVVHRPQRGQRRQQVVGH
jgi:hypothetical protein